MLPKDGTRHFGSINQGVVKLKLWRELPNTPGVYAFVSNKRYLYIGCSSDIRQRISAHNEHGFVVTGCVNNSYGFKAVPRGAQIQYWTFSSRDSAQIVERYLIQIKKPIRNLKEKSKKEKSRLKVKNMRG